MGTTPITCKSEKDFAQVYAFEQQYSKKLAIEFYNDPSKVGYATDMITENPSTSVKLEAEYRNYAKERAKKESDAVIYSTRDIIAIPNIVKTRHGFKSTPVQRVHNFTTVENVRQL